MPITPAQSEMLGELATHHHPRLSRPLGVQAVADHRVKLYAIEAPGRSVDGSMMAAVLPLVSAQLRLDRALRSTGLAVVIQHAGGDGDYVLVHTWVEEYMSRLAIFVGPADQPARLRPAPAGLAPCVWEAAVIAYERDAFVRTVLRGEGPLSGRIAAWEADFRSAGPIV